ncbi:MAG: DUF1460 domain-containing protein [Gammaproteobacteria bacterium]|nr:DUF1460 domain-containing protein [Gammaproteobacteria bacterium]MDH5629283.1 DUF1460 domain-containing protein [Gammaproteobacteria bacterium]
MKKTYSFIIVSILLLANSILLAANYDDRKWIDALPKPWTLTPKQIDEILPQFHQKFPDFKSRLNAIAHWRIDTPYQIFKLGEAKLPDTDPIFRLDVSDCTGHILTSLSLAQSQSWQEAEQNMIALHYKADKQGNKYPDYKLRWHYTSDRILNHPSTPNISDQIALESLMTSQTITLNQKENGSENLDLDWTLNANIKYIPSAQIKPELLNKLPALSGVAFVKPDYFKIGVLVAHEGMVIDGKYLLHASQLDGKTIKVDFMSYYFNNDKPRFAGILLYDFKPL